MAPEHFRGGRSTGAKFPRLGSPGSLIHSLGENKARAFLLYMTYNFMKGSGEDKEFSLFQLFYAQTGLYLQDFWVIAVKIPLYPIKNGITD